jgi:endoglucanase
MRHLVILVSLALTICCAPSYGQKFTAFDFHKGINISAWLSQTSVTSGPAREKYFTQKDVQQLAGLGFDHIRLPFNEDQLYNSKGERIDESFQLIHNVIAWCKEANMRVILDCHQTRDHDFSHYSSIVLYSDNKAPERFVKLWQDLSAAFGKYPNNLVAYEILNEPNAKNNKDWSDVALKVIKAVRVLEPERIILLGSNKANSVKTFNDVVVPENDPNIILSFHFYFPYLITHNQANFYSKIKNIDVPLQYPGNIVSDEVISKMAPATLQAIKGYIGVYNKDVLYGLMLTAINKAKKEGLRIHCGEFGSNFKYADRSLQLRWLQDMVAIFKENNIPYSYWGYRKEFGVFNDQKKVKDQAYLDVLVK